MLYLKTILSNNPKKGTANMAKIKIALFETTYGNKFPFTEAYAAADYIRLSDWVEVEFNERPQEEVLQDKLDLLDTAESELRAKYQAELENIKTMRQELLAITHQPSMEVVS